MTRGYLCVLLHAHLPFIRHPEYEDSLEERWLFEALTETYLPLLRMLESRAAHGRQGRITISLSPTLLAMFEDPLLRERYARHTAGLLELAEREVVRTRDDPRFHPVALHYRDRFRATLAQFEDRYRRDVTAAFRAVSDAGVVALITCGATHGFLPLMSLKEPSWRGQVGTAARAFQRAIGRPPEGMWLPECGYTPGVERVLHEFGIRWFVVDTHGILDACPRPLPGTYAPLRTESGVTALGRDADSSRQVWSATEGYPGDAVYREYYRDQGFDLPLEEVRAHLPSGGTRAALGLKYYRITDRSAAHREPYDPERARARTREHAAHFVRARAAQARAASERIGQPALLLAPYDAELFGHWWYEGPDWLEAVLDEVEREPDLEAADPSSAIGAIPRPSEGRLHPCSWGEGGHASVWLDPSNDWIYRHLNHAAERMQALARAGAGPDPIRKRALAQAARELLLAQASDWAFIMKTGTLVPYAVRRTELHLDRFGRLERGLTRGEVDPIELTSWEGLDPVFPDIDPGLFA
ncbi:MAG TPA: 1,4-alpha-glucan branching protein domain-containing protein [Candidatus Polarisedimenticolia bacterium]|nr:1,4-alpha-glucan branching protein domain-containing protein [Candidatus Polarisedimenticolia bacterium]